VATVQVATAKGVVLLVGGREVANVLVDYDPTAVSISPAGDQVAVGAANMKVANNHHHGYSLDVITRSNNKHHGCNSGVIK
jgi:hypothetical protein